MLQRISWTLVTPTQKLVNATSVICKIIMVVRKASLLSLMETGETIPQKTPLTSEEAMVNKIEGLYKL